MVDINTGPRFRGLKANSMATWIERSPVCVNFTHIPAIYLGEVRPRRDCCRVGGCRECFERIRMEGKGKYPR
jgi:hypothetical protein